MTAGIEIYTTRVCPYCVRAKELLNRKGAAFTEIDISGDETARADLIRRAEGRRTVPQIFINGKGIGGYDDLYALDRAGELDALLKGA